MWISKSKIRSYWCDLNPSCVVSVNVCSLICRWWRTITVSPTTRTPAWSLSLCITWQRCCAGLLRCRPTESCCSASRTCRAPSACAPASRTLTMLSAGACWNLWRSCIEVRKRLFVHTLILYTCADIYAILNTCNVHRAEDRVWGEPHHPDWWVEWGGVP